MDSIKNSGMLIRNSQHVGAQASHVKKSAIDNDESSSIQKDGITLSDQAEEGGKTGEKKGITGRRGAKETGRKQEKKKDKQVEKDLHDRSTPSLSSGENIEKSKQAEPLGPSMLFNTESSDSNSWKIAQDQPPAEPPASEGPGKMTEAAQKQQAAQSDMQEARTIYMQMAADRQKWMARIWQILQDTQNEIMKIMQESTIKRAQMMDGMAVKWAACLGGYQLR